MRTSVEDRSAGALTLTRAVRGQLRFFRGLLIAINLAVPLLLFAYSLVVRTEYWRLFDGEETAVNWLSSVQLVFLAVLACLNYRALSLLRRIEPSRNFRYQASWLLFAAAFLLLACDERFGYHEWLREIWSPGRYALVFVFAVGVAASFLLIGHLRRYPAALALFAAGLVLALPTVVISAADEATRYGWTLWYFWDYSFEEVAELWAQALFALAFLQVLHTRVAAIGRADGGQGTVDLLIGDARRQLAVFAGIMLGLNVLLPLGFGVFAAISGESFYELFWGERDAISWFSSLQLLAIGTAAWFVYHAKSLGLQPPFAAADPAGPRPLVVRLRNGWIWLVFACGFVFLAIDERFELHESVRDNFLQPGGHFADIPFIVAGDVALYFYLLVGLVFTAFLLRELKTERPALVLFVAAVVISGVIVVEDSLAPDIRSGLPFPGFWDSAFEEIGEIWAQFLFLASFLVFLSRRLLHLPEQ